MAVNFNGTTSKDENTGAVLGITTVSTIVLWAYADGQGESNVGQLLVLDETGNAIALQHNNSADTLEYDSISPGADGRWTFPATDGQWNGIAVRHNSSSLTNNPEARVNFSAVTVTEIQAPSQISPSPGAGYCIGNRTQGDLTWDGAIANVQVFNVSLTDREIDQALLRPGSVRRGLKLWRPLYHSGYLTDLSGNGWNGTAVDLTDRAGGPPCASLYSGGAHTLSTDPHTSIETFSSEYGFDSRSASLFSTQTTLTTDSAEFDFGISSAPLSKVGDLEALGAEFGYEARSASLTFPAVAIPRTSIQDNDRISRVGVELRFQTVEDDPRLITPIGVD